MSKTIALGNFKGAPSTTTQYYLAVCALLALTVLILAVARPLLLAPTGLNHALAGSFVLTALAVAGWKLTYRGAPRSFSLLLRAGVCLAVLHSLLHYASILPGPEAQTGGAEFLGYARFVAMAGGLVGLFRPSFALLPLAYLLYQKRILALESGLGISPTDYLAVVEFFLLLVIGFQVFSVGPRYLKALRADETIPASTRAGGATPVEILVLFAISVYYANYFHSGYAKLALDGGPLSWLTENRTHFLIPVAQELGQLPIASFDGLTSLTYQALASQFVALNGVVLLIELFSLLAVRRPSWCSLGALVFTVVHAVIFVLTGILFWKWMILNLGIAAAMWQYREWRIPRGVQAIAVLSVVLAPHAFDTALLAWYDTRAVNHVEVVGVTSAGQEYRVPSNYFLAASIVFAQTRALELPATKLPTGTYGTTQQHQVMREANACRDGSLLSGQEPAVLPDSLDRFIQRHHQFVLAHADENGRLLYDLYPHHIWSNPFEYGEFNGLDKRTIVAYRVVAHAKCLDFEDGAFVTESRLIGEREILVAGY